MTKKRNPELGRTGGDASHGPIKRRVPDGFAQRAEEMTRLQLQAHYEASQKIVARWVKEADVTPVQDPNFRNPGVAREHVRKPFKVNAYLTAAVDRPHRDISVAGEAAEFLRRFGPVYRCNERGRADPKGDRWRRGCAVLADADLIERAERNGWARDAWRRLAA